jgi:hypothetical protein
VTWFLLITCASLPVLWFLFLFLYGYLKGDTTRWQPVWVIGVLIDVYVNVIWGTIFFLQLPNPRRLLLSSRMDDLIVTDRGWRQWLAVQIVGRFLEPFDKSNPKQHNTYGEFTQ